MIEGKIYSFHGEKNGTYAAWRANDDVGCKALLKPRLNLVFTLGAVIVKAAELAKPIATSSD